VGHSLVKHGEQPVSASALAIEGQQHFTMEGMKDYEVPRALTLEEIKQIIQDYRQAALNAMEAGFDGVELHAAFGYLPDQFMAHSSNQRNDEYGGSVDNRNRFVLEVMQEMVAALGENRVAIRLSPTSTYNNISHQQPVEQFTALIEQAIRNFLMYSVQWLLCITFSYVLLVGLGGSCHPHQSHGRGLVGSLHGPPVLHLGE
jgi:N-ethylmaleimide reductase